MSIFRSDGNYIYLDVPYCEFYIPMTYFDKSNDFAEDLNDIIKVFGVFMVGIFENGKLKEMKTLNLPTVIDVNVYDSELREVTMLNGEKTQCKVLKYLKGANIMRAGLFEDDTYAKWFLHLLLSGKLGKIIPYSQVLNVWRKNQVLNGVNFGVSSLYMELIISKMYRNPNKLSDEFATIADESGDYDYTNATIRQVCQYSSTFTALTFEDFDSMITTSLNRTREHSEEAESPLEQIIKY